MAHCTVACAETRRDVPQGLAGKRGYDAAGYCNPELDAVIAPWRLAGGADGSLARYTYDPEGEARDLPSKISFTVPKGKGVRVEIPGGGGFGDPRDRDPAKVREDVRNGHVSAMAVEQLYGVKVDPVE